MTKTLTYILLSVILCFGYLNNLACSCLYVKKVSAEAFMFDGIVFSGKIMDIDTIYETYKGKKYAEQSMATFVVDNWFSSHEISDTVTVYTDMGGSCSLGFRVGESWLIYAYDQSGILQSNWCTPSVRSANKSFSSALQCLRDLKSKSGHIEEKLEWFNGSYTLSGKMKEGKPVEQWTRTRNKDTIAVFNFNDEGKHQGYQMEKNEDYDDTFRYYYETTDTYVKIFNSKNKLETFYELKNGRRYGRYEENLNDKLVVKANYRNGRLEGEWISWHEDTAIAKGKIKTIKIFSHDQLISSKRFDESGKEIEH